MAIKRKPQAVTGEAGLLLAVIDRAVADAAGRGDALSREEARRYLAGGEYVKHLDWLGLAHDRLPVAIEAAAGRAGSRGDVWAATL